MGELRKDALRLDFDRKLKLEFHGTKVTSDGGLLAYRELDDALGLTSTVDSKLRDIRTKHALVALLRQAVYSRLKVLINKRGQTFLVVLAVSAIGAIRRTNGTFYQPRWRLSVARAPPQYPAVSR